MNALNLRYKTEITTIVDATENKIDSGIRYIVKKFWRAYLKNLDKNPTQQFFEDFLYMLHRIGRMVRFGLALNAIIVGSLMFIVFDSTIDLMPRIIFGLFGIYFFRALLRLHTIYNRINKMRSRIEHDWQNFFN